MSPYVQQLYQALASPYGIVVMHENPATARMHYSQHRKKHGDPALQRISITILADEPKKLWLVKSPDPTKTLAEALDAQA
jgi:beta-galactosidase GanA